MIVHPRQDQGLLAITRTLPGSNSAGIGFHGHSPFQSSKSEFDGKRLIAAYRRTAASRWREQE